VLRSMDRSTIHYLHKKGWTKTQIAAFVAHVGQALTARLRPEWIDLSQGATLVASHRPCFGRCQRMVIPEHVKPVFERKPRAHTMVYRDWLVALAPSAVANVHRLCQRRYQDMAC